MFVENILPYSYLSYTYLYVYRLQRCHLFDQKRTRTFNRKTEDVAHTSLCVINIIPIGHLKRQFEKRQIWYFLTTEMTLEIAIRTYSDGDG